jgi:predicted phage terminase large subunit-like protein
MLARYTMPGTTTFDYAPHIRLIDQAILDCVLGRGPETLVVNMPPRHGKSEMCSRSLPVWFLGNWPNKNVLLLGYGQRFASRFGRVCRDRMRRCGPDIFGFGVDVDPKCQSVVEWGTTLGGWMIASGTGGMITGLGAHLIVADDLVKNSEEAMSERQREDVWTWWNSTLETRREPGCKVVAIGTRWHKEDWLGRLIEQSEQSPDKVRVINFPAIAEGNDVLGRKPGEALWPRRFPKPKLRDIEKKTPRYWWLALYQQRPTTHERSTWDEEHFDGIFTTSGDWPDAFELSALTVDPSLGKDAKKGDYSAIVFVGYARGKYWVEASIARRSPSRITQQTVAMVRRLRPQRVGVESNNFQSMLVQQLHQEIANAGVIGVPIHGIHNATNKQLRITETLDPFLQDRSLRVATTSGGKLLVDQLRDFPLGDHDDGPDALQMAMELLYWASGVSSEDDEEEYDFTT